MAHHAYFVAGNLEQGVEKARAFATHSFGLTDASNPDLVVLTYGLFSVDDARALGTIARTGPLTGSTKCIVVACGRIFHEAQNALLKLFEEPPEGIILILIVPSEGMLLPTLRSRLLHLPIADRNDGHPMSIIAGIAGEFLAAGSAGREKLVAKLLDRAKSDKDEEKQAARLEALTLTEGIMRAAYAARIEGTGNAKSLAMLLSDLDAFVPILHERSAPLKPIFEHLLLTVPSGLKG